MLIYWTSHIVLLQKRGQTLVRSSDQPILWRSSDKSITCFMCLGPSLARQKTFPSTVHTFSTLESLQSFWTNFTWSWVRSSMLKTPFLLFNSFSCFFAIAPLPSYPYAPSLWWLGEASSLLRHHSMAHGNILSPQLHASLHPQVDHPLACILLRPDFWQTGDFEAVNSWVLL